MGTTKNCDESSLLIMFVTESIVKQEFFYYFIRSDIFYLGRSSRIDVRESCLPL